MTSDTPRPDLTPARCQCGLAALLIFVACFFIHIMGTVFICYLACSRCLFKGTLVEIDSEGPSHGDDIKGPNFKHPP